MLLDTSGLLCLLHRAEPLHHEARHHFHSAHFRLTHSYVLAELFALATTRGVPRHSALSFLLALLENPVETVWVDEALNREALELLSARPDKEYSLCDAVSFVLMRHHGVDLALTTDRHFSQEGFRKLLARPLS